MRAHLVQYDIRWEDPVANFATIDAMLGDIAVDPGDLILLPEMFDTGFSLNLETTIDARGVSARWLAGLARRLGAYVQGGITVAAGNAKGLNRALVFDPQGEILIHYDKIHPFSYGREGERFVGGDVVAVFDWGPGPEPLSVCPAICYDLRFPELFRAGLSKGAEVFMIGANWPVDRQFHWRTLLQARAIENQAYVLATNRTGSDPHLRYAGGSAVIDPQGHVVTEAGDEETVLTAGISVDSVRSWRASFPAWQDRSPALGADASQKASKTV